MLGMMRAVILYLFLFVSCFFFLREAAAATELWSPVLAGVYRDLTCSQLHVPLPHTNLSTGENTLDYLLN